MIARWSALQVVFPQSLLCDSARLKYFALSLSASTGRGLLGGQRWIPHLVDVRALNQPLLSRFLLLCVLKKELRLQASGWPRLAVYEAPGQDNV